LRVQVDNSHQEDVPPLSGDFNVDGGIYRPVHLIVTDPICISPLNMASPGVYLTTKSLNSSDAQIEVKTLVSNGAATPADLQVKTDIAAADGIILASATQPASVASGTTAEVLSTIHLPSPHLWNGRKDPYLYTATVSLVRGKEAIDSIDQPLGLRTVAISPTRGFLLNGRPYPIHGVNRHQDWGDQGWAATPADYDEDARLILDMGVTAIRLTHYPQSDYWHNLCDRNGLLLWNEVSLVNEIRDTPQFSANAEQQLRELILQRYNHPSAAFWGLFNELNLVKGSPPPDALLRRLKSVIQEVDPSRLIVCAIAIGHKSYNTIADHPCFNRYPGWYQKFGMLESLIKEGAEEVGKPIGMSEYGAGANTAQHEEGPLTQPKPGGAFHPEEWQTHVHETDWAGMKDNPLIWGTFVWAMFDFQVAGRHEGSQPHLNDKGLVTQDRKIRKDSYYFYQANWTDKPMVHIASHRMTPRALAVTGVEVFSNCDKVELTVNGKSLGAAGPDNVKVFRWANVTLQPGRNVVQAIASSPGGQLTDTCNWVLDPASAPTPPPGAIASPTPSTPPQ
jgi:beta-galactosidase